MIDVRPYECTVHPDMIGPYWNVRVTPPMCQSQTVMSDFSSKAEARTWIAEESADWCK